MSALIQPIGCVNMLGLHSFPMPPFFLEGASQTWVEGNPLILASGLVTIAGTNPQTALIGIAAAKASGITDNPVPFIPFLPNLIFEISIDGAEGGGNAPGTGSLTQANVGTQYGITLDTASGNWYLDTSKTTVGTNTVMTLLGFQTQPTTTTSYSGVVNGRALVHFNSMVETGGTATALTIWA